MRRGFNTAEIIIMLLIIVVLAAMGLAQYDKMNKTRNTPPPNSPIFRGQIIGYSVSFLSYEREFLTRDPKGKYHILHFDEQWRLESDKEIAVDPGEGR